MFKTNRIIWLINKLMRFQRLEKSDDNFRVRMYWESKKSQIRILFGFLIIIFNIAGIEMSTPHYSITNEFASEIIGHVAVINNYIGIAESLKNKIHNDILNGNNSNYDANDLIVALKTIKFSFYIKFFAYGLFFAIFVFVFVNSDPFSKKYYLMDIIDEDKYKNWKKLPNVKDIFYYAKILPSNKLYYRCQECPYSSYCENSILEDKHKRNELWSKIFILLEPLFISNNLRMINQCRKWHFIKYGLLFSAFFLSIVYLCVRISEFLLKNLSVHANWNLLIIIIGCIIMFLFLREFDDSLKQLEDSLNTFYSSAAFEQICEKIVCYRKEPKGIFKPITFKNIQTDTLKLDYEKEIQKLKMSIEYFSLTNAKRIDRLIQNISLRKYRKPLLEDILSSIVIMYNAIYRDSHFSATLLIPDDNKLITWITENSEFKNSDNNDSIKDNDLKSIFELGGESIASQSWRDNATVSTNIKIPMIYENQSDNLKSLITIPIECSDELYFKANESEYVLDKIIAILCVSSPNGTIFTANNCENHSTILKPFVSMINFYYSLTIIDKIQKGI